jgi:hypothetical protein
MLAEVTAIAAGGLVGLGWGWIGTRVFRWSIVQDASAALVGWCLGTIVGIVVDLATFVLGSTGSGGLGSASAGFSETMLAWPFFSLVCVLTAQLARHRGAPGAAVSIALGGIAGATGGFVAASSIHWSS